MDNKKNIVGSIVYIVLLSSLYFYSQCSIDLIVFIVGILLLLVIQVMVLRKNKSD